MSIDTLIATLESLLPNRPGPDNYSCSTCDDFLMEISELRKSSATVSIHYTLLEQVFEARFEILYYRCTQSELIASTSHTHDCHMIEHVDCDG